MTAHEKVKHLETAPTLSELQLRIWITQTRQFVKKTQKFALCVLKHMENAFYLKKKEHCREAKNASAFENVELGYLGPLTSMSLFN